MAQKTIFIYNQNSKPFGPLSNNYYDPLVIDGKTWPTPSNFIYANLLRVPVYQSMLQTARVHGEKEKEEKTIEEKVEHIVKIYQANKQVVTDAVREQIRASIVEDIMVADMSINQLFDYYSGQEMRNISYNAIELAYNTKMNQDQKLADLLLQTDHKPIVYNSDNNLLGRGHDGKGKNLVGTVLMQIRQKLQYAKLADVQTSKIEEKNNLIFEAYKAMTFLQNELSSGRKIDSYIGQPVNRISKNSTIPITAKESIIGYYNQRQFPLIEKELETPGSMVRTLIEQNRPKEAERSEKEKLNTVCYLYIKSVIKKNYPNMSDENIETATKQTVFTIPCDGGDCQLFRSKEFEQFCRKVTDLYHQDKLDPSLTNQIKSRLEYKEDEEKSIEEGDKSSVSSSSSSESHPIGKLMKGRSPITTPDDSLDGFQKVSGEDTVLIDSSNPLSPTFNDPINIGGFVYPNVSIYLTVMLIKNVPQNEEVRRYLEERKSMKNIVHFRRTDKLINITDTPISVARNLIMKNGQFVSVDQAEDIYTRYKRTSYEAISYYLADVVLSKKFQSPFLQNLLILTNPAELIWNDKHDSFLGKYKDERKNRFYGQNKVGEILMKMRDVFLQQYKGDVNQTYIILQEVPRLFVDDDYIQQWIILRLKDLCSTVFQTQQYIENIPNALKTELNTEMDPIKQSISERFVKIVIDIIFSNCGELNLVTTSIPKIPDKFVSIVEECKGNSFSINDELKQVEEINKLIKSSEQLYRRIEERKEPETIEDALADILRGTDSIDKRKRDLDRKQKRDWLIFIRDITADQQQPKEIDKYKKFLEEAGLDQFIQSTKPKDQPRQPIKSITEVLRRKRNLEQALVSDLTNLDIQTALAKTEEELARLRTNRDESLVDEDLIRLRKKHRLERSILFNKHKKEEKELRYKFVPLEQVKQINIKYRNEVSSTESEKIKSQLKKRRDSLLNPKEYVVALDKLKEVQKEESRRLAEKQDDEIKNQRQKRDNKKPPTFSALEITRKIEEFERKQEQEKYRVLGQAYMLDVPKEPKERETFYKQQKVLELEHDKEIEELKSRVTATMHKIKQSKTTYRQQILQISNIYWIKIISLFESLINSTVKLNSESLRNLIILSQQFLSDQLECEKIEPFSNEESCIITALRNILISTYKLKVNYAEGVPLLKYDIDFAVSIIIGQNMLNKLVENKEEEAPDSEEEIVDEAEIVIDDDEDRMSDLMNTPDSVSFEFGDSRETAIQTVLMGLDPKLSLPRLKQLQKHFMEAMEYIKKYKTSAETKRNRINFFATLM